jgi:hypothetical protein
LPYIRSGIGRFRGDADEVDVEVALLVDRRVELQPDDRANSGTIPATITPVFAKDDDRIGEVLLVGRPPGRCAGPTWRMSELSSSCESVTTIGVGGADDGLLVAT